MSLRRAGGSLGGHRAGLPTAALALLLLTAPLFAGGAGPSSMSQPAPAPTADDAGPVRAGAGFFPLRPAALLAGELLQAGQARRFRVAGTPAGVPGEGVSAVALNVEIVTGGSAATATVFPAGLEPAPAAVTVAAGARGAASAFAVQRLPTAGELDVRAGGGPVAVTVRVRGYYAAPCGDAGAAWRPVQPTTLLDTILPPGGGAAAPLAGKGLPEDARVEAATVEVGAGGARGPGYLQLHPSGVAAPDDATLAFVPGRDTSVLEVVRPGPDGRVTITNRGGGEVRARVRLIGYHVRGHTQGGSAYQALDPSLLGVTTVRAGVPAALRVADAGRPPSGDGTATPQLAVVGIDPTTDGRLALSTMPRGAPAATIELRAGEIAAASALPQPDPDGRVSLSVSAGSVKVLVWAHGWFGAPTPLTATPDVAAFRAFDRRGATRPGWTRGSVSAPVRLPGAGTAWLFSEAFVGVLRRDGSQPALAPGPPRGKGPASALVHNSIVVQAGAKLTTYTGPVDKGTGYPDALLRPRGAGVDRWYWPDNGLVEGGALRVFVHEFRRLPTGVIAWTGRNRLVSLRLPGMTMISDMPLAGDEQGSMVQWGSAVLEEAGHTYVYGGQELTGGAKHTHVARFPRGGATGAWQYWDGAGWVADPAASVPLAGAVGTGAGGSTPGTVARLGAGYVLLTIADFGASIDVRTGCSPIGPWGPARPLYQIPEVRSARRPGDYALLPRGYPVGDALLVAYSLNPADLLELLRQASYYRPRYVTVR